MIYARGYHPLWPVFPHGYFDRPRRYAVPRPRRHRCLRFRLFRFRSPLLSESRLIYFPGGTEMCHFPPFARLPPMDSEGVNLDFSRLGCPIRVSPVTLVCSYPELIAAYHALHRLSAPRHPPYTLSNLPAIIRIPERSPRGRFEFLPVASRRQAFDAGRLFNSFSATTMVIPSACDGWNTMPRHLSRFPYSIFNCQRAYGQSRPSSFRL